MLVFELLTIVSMCLHRCSTSRSVPDVDLVIPPAAAGEAKYNEMLKLAENPKYGKCWTKALANLETSCRSMREEQQQILALSFTNCHLLMSGKGQMTCYTDSDASECTGRMNDLAFQIYTTFFTHSENLCFFVQAQLWQQWQAKTVQQLADTSAQVVSTLDSTLEKHKALELIVSKVHDILTSDLPQMVNAIEQLKSIVLGEYIWIHSVIFFLFSSLLSFLLTASRRTRGARCWMAVTLFVEFCLEVALLRLGAPNEMVYDSQWKLRKSVLGVVVIVWVAYFYSYRDISSENNRLLLELKHHLLTLTTTNIATSVMKSSNEEHVRSLQTGETLDCSMNAQLVSDDSMCASTTLPGSMNRNNSGLHVHYFMSEEEALRVDANEHDDVLQLADSQIEEDIASNESDDDNNEAEDEDDDGSWTDSEAVSELEEERDGDFSEDGERRHQNEDTVRETELEENHQSTEHHSQVQLTPTRRSYNLRPRTPQSGFRNRQSINTRSTREQEESADDFADSILFQTKLIKKHYESFRSNRH